MTDGVATIIGIEAASAVINRCDRDPVRVTFTFTPFDPSSQQCSQDSGLPPHGDWSFVIGDGKAPPRSCIEGAGVTVGSRLLVRRMDVVEGACTPVFFSFDPALVAACNAQCFAAR